MRYARKHLWPTLPRAFGVVTLFLLSVVEPAVYGQANTRTVVSRVQPTYPALASRMQIEGVVVVKASVQPNGVVSDAHATAGHALLRGSAEEAVRRWRFSRAPDQSDVDITVKFQLEALSSSSH